MLVAVDQNLTKGHFVLRVKLLLLFPTLPKGPSRLETQGSLVSRSYFHDFRTHPNHGSRVLLVPYPITSLFPKHRIVFVVEEVPPKRSSLSSDDEGKVPGSQVEKTVPLVSP